MSAGVRGTVLRELTEPEELVACHELQREIWGPEFSECVPYSLLLVAPKTGGLLAGALDGEGRLLGFVFGLAGFRDGRPLHWSHMLAVRPEERGRGLGLRLKRFQREVLLARGVEVAFWTYDPLVAQNAHLNLNRLGTEVVEYVENMYGRSTGSLLHGGGATDRLVVRWRLESGRARAALAGQPARPSGFGEPGVPPDPADPAAADGPPIEQDPGAQPALLEHVGSGRLRVPAVFPEAETLRIEIPWDLSRLLREEPELVRDWRQRCRRAFQASLARGYRVEALHRTGGRATGREGTGSAAAADPRCFYILSGSVARPGSSASIGSHISSNSS